METLEKDLILDKKQILQKIKRIAFEIFENNQNEKSLIIAGIDEGGYTLARLLIKELKKISPLELVLVKIKLDKAIAFGTLNLFSRPNGSDSDCIVEVGDLVRTIID